MQCMPWYILYFYSVAWPHPRQCRNDSPWFVSQSKPMHVTTSLTTTVPHDHNPRQSMSRYIPYFYCTARPQPQQYRNHSYHKVSSWSHTSLPSMSIGSAIFHNLRLCPLITTSPWIYNGVAWRSLITKSTLFMSVNNSWITTCTWFVS